MSDSLYLAWRYMRHHRIKTGILVASITLIVFLPAGLQVMVNRTAEQLAARARSTPLIVGRRGSALELALNSLYFESKSPDALRMTQAQRIRDSGLARAIPLHVRFRTRKQPIVGTTLDYFAFRGLRVERGRPMALLGECVVGADAAAALAAGPGDSVVSAPQNIFDLAGVYPLRMRVVGVLARTFSPDDEAVFVDVKTAWVIEGLAHGHAALKKSEILSQEGGKQVANASVVQYTEITPQ
ncbi:MAG: ABC transporter permease, partial [Planctomycetota bacterium]